MLKKTLEDSIKWIDTKGYIPVQYLDVRTVHELYDYLLKKGYDVVFDLEEEEIRLNGC